MSVDARSELWEDELCCLPLALFLAGSSVHLLRAVRYFDLMDDRGIVFIPGVGIGT